MLLELVKREGVNIDEASVGFAAGNSLARLMRQLSKAPANLELLHRADVLVALLQMLPFPVNYWEVPKHLLPDAPERIAIQAQQSRTRSPSPG